MAISRAATALMTGATVPLQRTIRVPDDGPGLPDDVRKRLFQRNTSATADPAEMQVATQRVE
jgi:hypothetical protein